MRRRGTARGGIAAGLVAALAAMAGPASGTALAALVQEAARTPLASEPPIQGPGWTVVVPAILFLVTAAGTWALWRHFADQDDGDE